MGSLPFIGLAVFTVGAFAGVLITTVVRRLTGDRSTFQVRLQSEQLQKQARELRDQTAKLEALEAERIRIEDAARQQERNFQEQVAQLTYIRDQIGERLDLMMRKSEADAETIAARMAAQVAQELPQAERPEQSFSDATIHSLIQPITETLARFDSKLAAIEDDRQRSLGAIVQHLEQVARIHAGVRDETRRLADALESTPKAFGRLGGYRLEQMLELAGLTPFIEKVPASPDRTGPTPDALLRLPGDRRIAIDANVPTKAFLDATRAESPEAEDAALVAHAGAMRAHLETLAGDAYRGSFETAPELVVMFMPGENLLAAALDKDPALFEDGVRQRVLMATPTTFVALARSIAYGWDQEKSTESIRELAQIGTELLERMATIGDQVAELGRGLETSVRSFNNVVGEIQGPVMSQLRRLRDLVPGKAPEMREPQLVDLSVHTPRRRRNFVVTQLGQEPGLVVTGGPESTPMPAPARMMAATASIVPERPRPTATPVEPF